MRKSKRDLCSASLLSCPTSAGILQVGSGGPASFPDGLWMSMEGRTSAQMQARTMVRNGRVAVVGSTVPQSWPCSLGFVLKQSSFGTCSIPLCLQVGVSWLLVIELKFSSFSLVCEFTINISGYTVLIFANQA